MRLLVWSTSFLYWKISFEFCLYIVMTGFYNPDGKSCSITAVLALLQDIKPFMDLVASKKGALCQKLYEVKKYHFVMVPKTLVLQAPSVSETQCQLLVQQRDFNKDNLNPRISALPSNERPSCGLKYNKTPPLSFPVWWKNTETRKDVWVLSCQSRTSDQVL